MGGALVGGRGLLGICRDSNNQDVLHAHVLTGDMLTGGERIVNKVV